MNSKGYGLDASRRDVLRTLASAAVGASLTSRLSIAYENGAPLPREGVFELGNLTLQSGATLRNAKLAYKTHGEDSPH